MYKETFHLKIKEARKKSGYTQQEVAKETGIPRTTIAFIETGRTEPSLENLGKLIDFYQINANWVLGTGIYENRKEKNSDKNIT